jgi:hypothetical protein
MLCGQMDSQSHCMHDCTHAPYTRIRAEARDKQGVVAQRLFRAQATSPTLKHFIEQICHGSWINTLNTHRLGLGRWNQQLLGLLLLRQNLKAPMSSAKRHTCIKIARKLTAPLLVAYYEMTTLVCSAQGDAYIRSDADSVLLPPNSTAAPLPPQARAIPESMHMQQTPHLATSLLTNLNSIRTIK